jgi:O-antigen ligase
MGLFFFFRTNGKNRMYMVVAAVLGIGLGSIVLSKSLRERYSTIFEGKAETVNSGEVARSAVESSEVRQELMRHALIIGAQHPIFGVGLSQFQIASSELSIARHQAPMWRSVHSVLLMVFSETGVPGLIFYVGAWLYCFRALVLVSRAVKKHPELAEFRQVTDVFICASVGFIICMFFNTDAYLFHFPFY